jgi:methyl-accepting chemotaxis protein
MAGGFFSDKAYEVMKEMMEREGIDPGELNERIGRVTEMMNDLAPIVMSMKDTSEEFSDNVEELNSNLQDFNNNADEIAESIDELADSMEKVGNMMDRVEDESDEW